ncbi:hypothetical protein IWQ60_007345, partial [Tieghemiomyces parasiticus]
MTVPAKLRLRSEKHASKAGQGRRAKKEVRKGASSTTAGDEARPATQPSQRSVRANVSPRPPMTHPVDDHDDDELPSAERAVSTSPKVNPYLAVGLLVLLVG